MKTTVANIQRNKVLTDKNGAEFPRELEGGRNYILNSKAREYPLNTPRSGYYLSDTLPAGKYVLSMEQPTVTEGVLDTAHRVSFMGDSGSLIGYKYLKYPDLVLAVDLPKGANRIGVEGGTYSVGALDMEMVLNKIKLEEGSKTTRWTPAPEDLGLTYSNKMKEFVPDKNSNSTLATVGNYLEYPEVLSGTRNLAVSADGYGSWGGTSDDTIIRKSDTDQSFIARVKEGEKYIFSYQNTEVRGTGDRYFWFKEYPIEDRSEKSISGKYGWLSSGAVLEAPKGAKWLFLKVSEKDKLLKNVQLETGTKISKYRPTPESLGFEISDKVQNFLYSVNENNVMTPQLIEYPMELSGTRNMIQGGGREFPKPGREFINTLDCAPLFDAHPGRAVTIGVDIKSPVLGRVQIYQQNGSGARYNMTGHADITEVDTFKRFYVRGTPSILNDKFEKSMLAFYGIYDSGRFPLVRNIKIEFEDGQSEYTAAPEDLGLDYPDWVESFKPSINKRGILMQEFVEGSQYIESSKNLVLDSAKGWSSSEYNVIQGAMTEDWIVGGIYTASLKGTLNPGQTFGLWRDSGSAQQGSLTPTGIKDVYAMTFECSATTGAEKNTFSIYNVSSGGAEQADIEWIKIEKGTETTQWTPAPEDYGRTEW